MKTNPPTFRYPFALRGVTPDVREAHVFAFNGILDLQEAISQLKSQITTLKPSPSSSSTGSGSTTVVTGVTSFNGETGVVSYFPNLGNKDDQTGQTSYVIQQSDSGALLILNDASPVAVSLNPTIVTPFFMFAMNLGAGTVTFTPTSPSLINFYQNIGATSMPLLPGSMALIQYDGVNWWGASSITTGLTNPMTTEGDMIYGSPGSTPKRLPVGIEGQFLSSNGTDPVWANLTQFIFNEKVSGSGTAWTLSKTPIVDGVGNPAVRLFNGAAAIFPGLSNDYVLAPGSKSITMNYSVPSGSLWADYQYQP